MCRAPTYTAPMSIATLTDNKKLLFWLLQLWGWSAWAVTFYLGVAFWGTPAPSYPGYLAIIAVFGMLITLPLRLVYQRSWDKSPALRAMLVLLCSYLAGAAWILSRREVFQRFYPEEVAKMAAKGTSELAMLFEQSLTAASVMLVWSALYFGIKYYLLSQEEKQRYLAAVGRAHQAQLKMLRYQLNPHFLFNTLNAISTLILDQQNTTANDMVSKLSRFLRYSLESDPMREVTVNDEVASLLLYLEIEKVRFGDRLELDVQVAEEVGDALMPSMLLQPLVENAIKYAIAKSVSGGTIRITAARKDDWLLLCVSDDGPGLESPDVLEVSGTGVGIANIKGRLQELYGSRQACELRPSDPSGLAVDIRLPLHKNDPSGAS